MRSVEERISGVESQLNSLEKRVCNGDGSLTSEVIRLREKIDTMGNDINRRLDRIEPCVAGLKAKTGLMVAIGAIAISALFNFGLKFF